MREGKVADHDERVPERELQEVGRALGGVLDRRTDREAVAVGRVGGQFGREGEAGEEVVVDEVGNGETELGSVCAESC